MVSERFNNFPTYFIYLHLKNNLQKQYQAYPGHAEQTRNQRSDGIYTYANSENRIEKIYEPQYARPQNAVCDKAHGEFYRLEENFRNDEKNEQAQYVSDGIRKNRQKNHPLIHSI